MTTYKEIQKKDDKDLVALVQEKREEIRAFRFQNTGGATRDVRAVRTAKKDVARSLTELNTRRSAEAETRGESKKSA